MANRRGEDGGFEQPERENPFDALDRQDETVDENAGVSPSGDMEDVFEEDPYEQLIDEDDENDGPGGLRGFLSTVQGKALCIAVAVLTLILIGVIVWRFAFFKPEQGDAQLPGDVAADLPGEGSAPSVVFGPADADTPDDGPTSMIFMPEDGETEDFASEPYDEQEPDTDAPAGTPVIFSPIEAEEPVEPDAPEETLPIVMSNTATPSPTVAPTPSPTPSPEPTSTPTPSPTPIADIGTGKTNRDANLRSEMSAKSSVKKLVKRGESVTIHEAVMDDEGKLWYALTVDDISTDGWMRDYVVALDGPLAQAISYAPAGASGETAAAASLPDGVIGTGKTNRDANVRKIMNGKVVTQLRKNHKVNILAVKQDKAGDTWYQIRTENGTTGYVRDYLITLTSGTVLPGTQTSTQSGATANPTAKISLPTPGPTGTPTPRPTIIPTVPPPGMSISAAASTANGASSALNSTSPSALSTASPSALSTTSPSALSTARPSTLATTSPSALSTARPSTLATTSPSALSTARPSGLATASPSGLATPSPSALSTARPSGLATANPSGLATAYPSALATANPSGLATAYPSAMATAYPAAVSPVNPGMQAAQQQTVDPANRPSIGVAYTNRDANIREKPFANAKLVRQLSHGTELRVLGKYESEGNIWYEVVTTSGKTYGFARDYVLTIK